MSNYFKTVLKKTLSAPLMAAYRLKIAEPAVILAMDGGICSQMNFYLTGEYYRERGLKVIFDISWFDSCGKDLDGRFARKLDLPLLFPYLPWEETRSVVKLGIYRKLFASYGDYEHDISTAWTGYDAPLYLCGYHHNPEDMYSRLFRKTFRVDTERVLDDRNKAMLEQIRHAGAGATAMHVRRGDLSAYNPVYGHPASAAYFRAAAESVMTDCKDAKFFVFSDEPEWVRNELLPKLPAAADVTVADLNGPEHGYMDLALMAQCRNQITSQGSHGKFAAMMRDDMSGMVVLCDTPHSACWSHRFANAKILPV